MSFQSYSEYLSKHTIITDSEDARMVKRAGQQIQNAVEQYFSDHNMSNSLKGYNWEFKLIADKSINAWCMPGGKVAVYTGILP